MRSLRKMASRARMKTRVAMFGNNHSFKVNLKYAAYENAARRSWKPRTKSTPEQLASAERFKKNGFEVLPPPKGMTPEKLRALKEAVDNQFEEQNNGFSLGVGMSRLIDGI